MTTTDPGLDSSSTGGDGGDPQSPGNTVDDGAAGTSSTVDWDSIKIPSGKTNHRIKKSIKKVVKGTASIVNEARMKRKSRSHEDRALLVVNEASHDPSDEGQVSDGRGTKRPHPPSDGWRGAVDDKKQKKSDARRLRRQKMKLVRASNH